MKKKISIMFILAVVCCIQLLLSDIVVASHYQIDGSSEVKNQVYKDYTDKDGGVFYVTDTGVLKVSSSTLKNNISQGKGGAIYNKGIISMEDVDFSSNSTTGYGGAIYNGTKSTLIMFGDKVSFSSNTSGTAGGAISNNVMVLTEISGSSVIFNSNQSLKSGAIYNDNRSSTTISGENIFFSSNSAESGGAIYNINSSSITITGENIFFSSNSATMFGGVIYNYEGSTITVNGQNIKFNNNMSNLIGGAIYNDNRSSMTIKADNISFSSNSALMNGGVIYNDNGSSMAIIGDNIQFKFNETIGDKGGVIFNNSSSMTIIGENIEFNSNKATTNNGGAIYNNVSSMTIIGDNIEFNFNKATEGSAGAIYNDNGSIITVSGQNIEFSSNVANGGGAIHNNNISIFTINGLNVEFNNNIATSSGGAIYNENSTLNLVSKGTIVFTGNKANGISNAIHDKGGTINLFANKDALIIFNDRITSEDDSSVLNINKSTTNVKATGKIVLNENMKGYRGKVNLYDGTVQIGKNGTWFGGKTYVDNATIDIASTITQEHNFNELTVNKKLNLLLSADLENKKMNTITADSYSGNGKINVKSINIFNDREEKLTEILFTSSTVLKENITATKIATSGLYKYGINYNNSTGNISFDRLGLNPVLSESQVASAVGGTITQTTILNNVFAGMDSIIQNRAENYSLLLKNKKSKFSNLYASSASNFFSSDSSEKKFWIRPYAVQDTIKINGLSVDNTAIGTLAGVDLSVEENSLYSCLLSLYVGYAGSTQKYDDIKINQNGYIIGATGMLIREDYYLGLTANINFNKAEGDYKFGHAGKDKFDMNMYSVGAKAGYNIDLGKKWTLEPNLILMYGNIDTKGYTTTQNVKIDAQKTNSIFIDPQIKAKLELANGWTPYVLVGYVLNSGNKTKLVAQNIVAEDMKIQGYTEYGLGVNKNFDYGAWSCFLQVTGRNGDRKGVEGNIGVKYSI